MDVDFLPSNALSRELASPAAQRELLAQLNRRTVIVLPAFETSGADAASKALVQRVVTGKDTDGMFATDTHSSDMSYVRSDLRCAGEFID